MSIKLPKNWDSQVRERAETIPREVLANVLMALMPRVAVSTRAPIRTDPAGQRTDPQPGPFRKLMRGPRTRKLMRGPRTRSPKGQRYTVLQPTAYLFHRNGTWRYAMVRAAVRAQNDDDDSPRTTLAALKSFQETYPAGHKYHEQGIDFNWLAKVGYIAFNIAFN